MALLDDGASKKRQERPRDVPKVSPDLQELLSADDIERIRDQARITVAAEKKKQAEDQYLAKALEEERRELEPEQELVPIVIDVAPFTDRIMIDSKQYFQGHVYQVSRRLYAVLTEIMARSWAHDEEVGSPNRKFYEKPSHVGTGNYASVHPAMKDTLISPRQPEGVSRQRRAQAGA